MKESVYIETTIPSFYFEERKEPEMVARREWTRRWWDAATKACDLVTSGAVVDELERGEYESRESCLELLTGLPILAVEPPVLEIVETYMDRHVMPRDPVGDALHLALASYHRRVGAHGAGGWAAGTRRGLGTTTRYGFTWIR